MRLCQRGNSAAIWDSIMKFLCQQEIVESSDEFENGCIPLHFDVSDALVSVVYVSRSMFVYFSLR